MLTYIKTKIKGWVAWLIVVIIAIPFALFGISEYLNTPSDVAVAEIEGREILRSQYLNQYEQARARYRSNLGANYNDEIDKLVKRNVIQEILRDEILDEYANTLDIAITDKELASSILVLEDFQNEDGEFSIERYRRVLRLSGLTEPLFEQRQKKSLLRNQFIIDLADSAFVSDNRKKMIVDLLSQERKFSYIELSLERFLEQAAPKKEDARALYDKNVEAYIQPRMAKVNYIDLSADSVSEEITASDEDLQALYAQEKESLAVSEERSAKHILVEDESLADEILVKIENGKSFDELAKEYSIDDGSKDQGGDLGFFGKGIMVPEFEEFAFSSNEGDVSKVQTEFGYHIIKITGVKEAKIPNFEEVKEKLERQYKQEKVSDLVYKMSEDFANAAYGNTPLEEVAKQFNLELKETEFFSETDVNDESVLRANFVQSAFSNEVYENAENSNVFESNDGVFTVISLIEKKAQRQLEFAEVEEKITNQLKNDIAQNNAIIISKSIEEAINKGDVKRAGDIMKELGVSWSESTWVDRGYSVSDTSIELRSLVFSMPSLGSKVKTLVTKFNKGSILIKLEDIRVKTSIEDVVVERLNNVNESAITGAVLQTITESVEYEIKEERL